MRDRTGYASISALMALARGQALLPGRKVILYFWNGMYIPEYLREQFTAAISAANRANVSIYTLDLRGLHVDAENAKAQEELNAAARITAQVMADRGGDFTTIEQVIYGDRGMASMQANVQNALADLASGTGGFLIANTNDFRPALRRVERRDQHLLRTDVRPRPRAPRCRVPSHRGANSRPDLKIQARSGYYALPPVKGGRSLPPYEVPLLAALDNPAAASTLSFYDSLLVIEPSSPTEVTNAVIVQVPLRQVDFKIDETAKRYRAHLSLLAHVKDKLRQRCPALQP